jgi:tetratricopeptide (TPR) repeat protein
MAALVVCAALGAYAAYRLSAPSPAPVPRHDDPAVYEAYVAARADVLEQPRSAAAWGKLGMTLVANRDHVAALEYLAQAEQLDPDDYRWPYLQAVVLQQARADAALAKARRAKLLAPRLLDVHVLAGEFELAGGNVDQAAAAFEQALRLDPDQPHALLGKARCQLQAQKLEESHALLQRLQSNGAVAKAANALLAEVLHRLGRSDEAQAPYRLAQRLPLDRVRTDALTVQLQEYQAGFRGMRSRAESLAGAGQIEAALALQHQTIARYPENFEAHFDLGRLYALRAGRQKERAAWERDLAAAGASLKTAERLAPRNLLVKFYLGLLYYEQRGHPEALRLAIEHFGAVVEGQPHDTVAAQHLGECLLLRGDWTAAATTYRRLVQLRPDLPQAHAGLAEALEGAQASAEAMSSWLRAAHLDGDNRRWQTRLLLAARRTMR